MIYANIIADSVNGKSDRLTTMEVQFHRFILPEFNTHRVFSRNSASSRAIPIASQIERILEDPAIPVCWGKNQPGMQAYENLGARDSRKAEKIWRDAVLDAAKTASKLSKLGVHKQITNRILEPFMWHKVIVTSTSWDNFFEQRCSELAQPEIKFVAEMMRDEYRNSVPNFLTTGEYHLPYITSHEQGLSDSDKIKVSVARCARVSYLTHDKKRDIVKDIQLFDKLANANPPHWSPMEHVATPLSEGLNPSGNFNGYAQIRHNPNLIGK